MLLHLILIVILHSRYNCLQFTNEELRLKEFTYPAPKSHSSQVRELITKRQNPYSVPFSKCTTTMKAKCTDPHSLVLKRDCSLLHWKGTIYYLKYFHMHIPLSPPYFPIHRSPSL